MRVIENFFFTPIQTANILITDLLPSREVSGESSKQRSPFASEDVLIGLEHLHQRSRVGRIEWQP